MTACGLMVTLTLQAIIRPPAPGQGVRLLYLGGLQIYTLFVNYVNVNRVPEILYIYMMDIVVIYHSGRSAVGTLDSTVWLLAWDILPGAAYQLATCT